MALNKLRRAIGAVKDQTSIGLAKLNNNSPTLSDLEVAIVKVTRHEEYPPEEKHIKEILSLTRYSRGHVGSCVTTIARRLSKTKNWVVALKALMLIHRLLNDGNNWYEQEIFFATRRGTRLLNMSDFRATSRSDSWDYSAFVRTYALYLDEILDNRMQGKRGKHSSYSYRDETDESGATVSRSTPIREMKFDQLFLKTNHLVQIIERFLACRPTGHASTNRLVLVALYPIVKESFRQYYDITGMLGILIDRFMDLGIPESIKVHEMFCRCAKQFDEMYSFYCWTRTKGIARISEYPKVEHISQKKLQVMDEFIRENIDLQKRGKSKTIEDKIVEEIDIGAEPEINSVKALPPPDGFPVQREEKAIIVEVKTEEEQTQEIMADFLNLGDDALTIDEHGDQLALALFDGLPPTTSTITTGPSPWEAFKDLSDWETALVQSGSYLSNQHAELPHGLDISVLDAMYQNDATNNQYTASSGFIGTGSASSVALGSAGRTTMLALPAPETQYGSIDPFEASFSVPPPPYVQIHDMEMKQRHLVEEQLIWQQYKRDGMHGQMAFGQMQPNPYYYNTGSHTQTYYV